MDLLFYRVVITFRNLYSVLLRFYKGVLQLKDLRVGQCEESCIRVNIKELNRELCTGLSTLYTKTTWSMLLYF